MDMLLDKLQTVKVQKPEELIIVQFRDLLQEGVLKPGDRLPSERHLAEQFGVGRGYVRLALQRLEFYGIVKIHHKSGSYVSDLGVAILDGLLTNILSLEKLELSCLLESRMIVEAETAALAALRASEKALDDLQQIFSRYNEKVLVGADAMEEDLLFHIRIAECANNPVLRTMIMVVAQDIIRKTRDIDGCEGSRKAEALNEHRIILDAILSRNAEAARMAMQHHLNNTKITCDR